MEKKRIYYLHYKRHGEKVYNKRCSGKESPPYEFFIENIKTRIGHTNVTLSRKVQPFAFNLFSDKPLLIEQIERLFKGIKKMYKVNKKGFAKA